MSLLLCGDDRLTSPAAVNFQEWGQEMIGGGPRWNYNNNVSTESHRFIGIGNRGTFD